MRLISIQEMVDDVLYVFEHYAEPLACSFMYGEVPASTIMIHRTGTYDKDWLAKVRFKNSVSISVFRCEVYLEDVLGFCRDCHMWLVTKEIFDLAVAFTVIFPLYQTQFMNFKETGVETGYHNMMTESGYHTYKFLKSHYRRHSEIEDLALEIFYYNSMRLNQTYKYLPKEFDLLDHLGEMDLKYKDYMSENHQTAFNMARFRKSQNYLINKNGFILMEDIGKQPLKQDQTIDMDRQAILEELKQEQAAREEQTNGKE